MYEEVKKIDWSKYILKGKTFSVDSVVYSEEFKNSRFVTYKVKDAIVDQFRESTGTRPNISVSNPDIRLNIHVLKIKQHSRSTPVVSLCIVVDTAKKVLKHL